MYFDEDECVETDKRECPVCGANESAFVPKEDFFQHRHGEPDLYGFIYKCPDCKTYIHKTWKLTDPVYEAHEDNLERAKESEEVTL